MVIDVSILEHNASETGQIKLGIKKSDTKNEVHIMEGPREGQRKFVPTSDR